MIDNSPEGIMHMHKQMLMWRNQAMTARQFEIAEIMTVMAAHLADYAAIVKLTQAARTEWNRVQEKARKEHDQVPMRGHGMPDLVIIDEPFCIPEDVQHWLDDDGNNKAAWTRSDSDGSVRITATWQDVGATDGVKFDSPTGRMHVTRLPMQQIKPNREEEK